MGVMLLLACAGQTPAGQDSPADTVHDTMVDTHDTHDSDPDTAPPCEEGLQARVDGAAVSALELGRTAERADELVVDVELVNLCHERLRLLGVPADWVSGEGFALGDLPPIYLEPGASAEIQVVFAPGDAGDPAGTLRLPYDQPGSPLELALSASVAGPRALVFVGDGRHVATTPDYGATWPVDSYETLDAHGDALQRGVCWGHAGFVAVGGNVDARWWTSADGLEWTAHADSQAAVLGGCAYLGGRYVAFSSDPWWSDDGQTWTRGTQSAYNPDHLRAVAAGDGVAVAVGDAGRVSVTADGSAWTHTHDLDVVGLVAVAHGQGTWVAVGGQGAVATSVDDGATWTTQSIDASADLAGVVWAGDRFVVGSGSQIWESPDGVSWAVVNTYGAVPRVAVGRQVFGVQGQVVSVSQDGGFTWTELYTSAGGLGLTDAIAEGL